MTNGVCPRHRKVNYVTRDDAYAACVSVQRRRGKTRYPYPCRDTTWWHITSQVPNG